MNFKFFGGWFRSAIITLLPAFSLMVVSSAHAALIGIVPSYPDVTTSGSDINYVWTPGTGGSLTINGNAGSGTPPAQANQSLYFFSGDTLHSIYGCSTLGISTTTCATPNSPNSFYSLTANFDASGAFTGGALSMLGYVDASSASGYQAYDWNGAAAGGAPTGTLLTANLTDFGFKGVYGSATYDVLQLDFSITLTGGDFFTAGYTGNGLKWVGGHVYSGSSAPYGGDWDLQAAPFTKSFSCGNGDATKPCLATLDTYVPVPAAVWLFGSGLVGLLGVAGRRRASRAG
jgi:hypothetical protein